MWCVGTHTAAWIFSGGVSRAHTQTRTQRNLVLQQNTPRAGEEAFGGERESGQVVLEAVVAKSSISQRKKPHMASSGARDKRVEAAAPSAEEPTKQVRVVAEFPVLAPNSELQVREGKQLNGLEDTLCRMLLRICLPWLVFTGVIALIKIRRKGSVKIYVSHEPKMLNTIGSWLCACGFPSKAFRVGISSSDLTDITVEGL